MLQNRTFEIVLICLIIIQQIEQGQQAQGRWNNALQTRQLPAAETVSKTERKQKSEEMLKYMNLSADACTDFYEYACGNWLKYQNADAMREGELISVQTQMEANVNKQLQLILNEATNVKDSMPTKIMKDFYRSCVRVTAVSPNQKQFMKKFVLHHGGSPDIKDSHWKTDYNWIDVIAELKNQYGIDILIGLNIDKNPNNGANTIYLEEPQTTLLPVELCSSLALQKIDENEQVFNQIQNEVRDNLRNWFELSESSATRIAGGIIRFEYDLCKHMRKHHTASVLDEELDDPYSRRGPLHSKRLVENKIHGVQQNSDSYQQDLDKLSERYEIDFKSFVDNSLGTSKVSKVYFRSEDYFKQLSTIAKKGLQASFANYIMYRALAEINFPINERQQQRPSYCVQKVMRYFSHHLGELYNYKFQRTSSTADIKDMFLKIKEAFSKNLDMNVPWITNNVKRAIKQKLFTIELNQPSYNVEMLLSGLELHDDQDYWQKLEAIMKYNANKTTQHLQWTVTPFNFIEASAVAIDHKPTTTQLLAGLGLLQKPFYSTSYPQALKYSSIGIAIVREFVKILDDVGWHQNSKNYAWDAETMRNSVENTECFRYKLSNYFHNNPYEYRNASKLHEVMVETSSLNIAFNAYLNWLANEQRFREELDLETFPDMNFTNTQLFFIHFAQTHCAVRHVTGSAPPFLPFYRRTMEKFDINGPLSNNKEFGRDFGCQIGSDMNEHDICSSY